MQKFMLFSRCLKFDDAQATIDEALSNGWCRYSYNNAGINKRYLLLRMSEEELIKLFQQI